MLDAAAACLTPGSEADAAAELRRQAVLVDDLAQRLEAVVRALPLDGALEGWWGPARDALQEAIDIERARLGREIGRLEGVRIQLQYAADETAAVAASALPGGAP